MLVSDSQVSSAWVFVSPSLNPCFSGCWSRTGRRRLPPRTRSKQVLILVLVDVGLGPPGAATITVTLTAVLILVLVDVGLGLGILGGIAATAGLNPCFSGCWSRTDDKDDSDTSEDSLNPCFSGCWSRTGSSQRVGRCSFVLILVLVDVGLGHLKK